MDLKSMKRIAEKELYRYRDNRAYVQGVLDAGGDAELPKLREHAAWTLAVEYARTYFERTDPAKAAFLTGFYRLDRPQTRRSGKRTMAATAMQLHVTETTLHKWKNEVLTVLVMAAVQTGALRPYSLDDGCE